MTAPDVYDPSSEYPRQRRLYQQVSACMGFAGRPEGEQFTWETQLQVPFRALGLLVWGVTNDTLVHQVLVGHTKQLQVSGAGFPARFFEAGFSFAELTALFSDEAEAEAMQRAFELPAEAHASKSSRYRDWFAWMKEHPLVEAHQRIVVDTCNPGVNLSITCSGPIEALCIWGNAIR